MHLCIYFFYNCLDLKVVMSLRGISSKASIIVVTLSLIIHIVTGTEDFRFRIGLSLQYVKYPLLPCEVIIQLDVLSP